MQLTEVAQKEVKKLLDRDSNEESFLRIGVKGGGCAGFTYDVKVDDKLDKTDRVFEFGEGIKLVTDIQSLFYLQNTTIDFSTGLVGAGFTFENPNATGSCGCGTSFSV